MEVMADGNIRYIDVKGYKTKIYELKRKLVEAAYPVKIIEAWMKNNNLTHIGWFSLIISNTFMAVDKHVLAVLWLVFAIIAFILSLKNNRT